MPVKRITTSSETTHPELVSALAEELRLESETGPEDAPYIVEEVVPHTQHLNVTVIWDRWAGVIPETRGQVILNAYEAAKGEKVMRSITIALGLTRTEARRLGVAF